MSECADTQILADLLADQLSAAEVERWSEHLAECTACQQALEKLAGADVVPSPEDPLARPPTVSSASLSSVVDQLKQPSDGPADERDQQQVSISPESMLERLNGLGRYEVGSVVGRGGMGIVFQGHDQSLNRSVAIKLLQPHLAADSEMRERFYREARSAAAIEHESVVTIHGVEENDRQPFLVMQYITGRPLDLVIREDKPLPVESIVRWSREIAEGLAAAHAQSMVHRDIKPANILIEAETDKVKITDFGLAKAADDVSLTQSGTLAGTPAFMAPEQADAAEVDGRTDLFSLGSVMYTMCAGQPPFDGQSTWQIIRQVCEHEPKPLTAARDDLPKGLTSLISRLMEKDPAQRPQSAEEVIEWLDSIAAGREHEADTVQSGGKRFALIGIPMIALITLGTLAWLAYNGAIEPKPGPVAEVPSAAISFRVDGVADAFATLREAVAAAPQDGRIEIVGEGVIKLTEPVVINKPLTISSSAEKVRLVGSGRSEMFFNRTSLTLSGLGIGWSSEDDPTTACAIRSVGQLLILESCRIAANGDAVSLEQGDCEVKGSLIAAKEAAIRWQSTTGDSLLIADSILHAEADIRLTPDPSTSRTELAQLAISASTFSGRDMLHFQLPDGRDLRNLIVRRNGLVDIEIDRSVIGTQRLLNFTNSEGTLAFAGAILPEELHRFINGVVQWHDGQNLYANDLIYAASNVDDGPPRLQNIPEDLSAWLEVWGGESESVAATISYPSEFEVTNPRRYHLKSLPIDGVGANVESVGNLVQPPPPNP